MCGMPKKCPTLLPFGSVRIVFHPFLPQNLHEHRKVTPLSEISKQIERHGVDWGLLLESSPVLRVSWVFLLMTSRSDKYRRRMYREAQEGVLRTRHDVEVPPDVYSSEGSFGSPYRLWLETLVNMTILMFPSPTRSHNTESLLNDFFLNYKGSSWDTGVPSTGADRPVGRSHDPESSVLCGRQGQLSELTV